MMLAQIHGAVWLAVNDVDSWIGFNASHNFPEQELSADDIRNAAYEVHPHFGTLQAALNTGKYDTELVRVGISGAQGYAKRKGLGAALGRLFGVRSKASASRVRGGLRWGGTLIGSITAALKGEVERVPGAAAAGEAIKEFMEVLLNATEPRKVEESATESPKAGQEIRPSRKG
ncbi:MAG TPA: hypothetical protein VGL00_02310 [Terracidiphilus sp.]